MSASADGWNVRLESPHGDADWLADEILSVDIQPEHSALYDAEIDCAPVFDRATYRFGEADIYRDGTHRLTIDIESAQQGDDGTITITGRESDGLSLVGDEIERTYSRRRVPDVIRGFWRDETDYEATVHDPPPGVDSAVTNEVVTSARTQTEWDDILHARTRDEQGRYQDETDGTAPNFEPADPLQLTARGVELRQSNWLRNGEDWDSRENGVNILEDEPGAVDETAAWLNDDGAAVEYTIETGYEIPRFAVVPRWRCPPETPNGTITIDVDNETLKTTAIQNVVAPSTAYSWDENVPPKFVLREPLDAGEHTITITKLGGTSVYLDVVSMQDTRFSYNYALSTDAYDQLSGPELYPDNYYMRLGRIESGIDVDEVAITATYDSVAPSTNMSAFITDMGTQRRTQTAPRQTYRFGTTGDVPRIVPYPRLARTGNRYDTHETPTRGYESQVLEAIEIAVTGEAVPIIPESGRTFSGDRLSILQKLHEDAGYHFAPKHGPDRGGGPTVESFQRGDPRRVRELPAAAGRATRTDTAASPDAVVTDIATETTIGGYANRVTVVGADYPRAIRRDDDPRRFEATLEDSREIEARGLHPVTVTDTSLETHDDVLSRARTELRERLNADGHGGSLSTSPLFVEPGYLYEVGAFADGDPAMERLTGVPSGEERVVGADGPEHVVVWQDVSLAGTLRVVAGGRVTIAATGSLSDAAGGALVEDGGVIESLPAGRIVQTCESWSYSESAGDASASGEFGRRGGLGGTGRTDILTLLTGGATAD